MTATGAQIIIETLIEQGCDTVFGYPGGAVLHIYDQLYQNSDRIRHILSAHEQGACHAADGYARTSGKVGVVFATSGPGATNLVTGIANAYLDSTPLVAIIGNVALPLLGRDSFQEVDTFGITMPVTKHNYIVKDVRELAGIIREAFLIAKSGRPGPVTIDVPKDIQTHTCEFTPEPAVRPQKPPTVPAEEIDRVIGYIGESERPYIYCGGGAVISGAGALVRQLAERIDAPIGFSMMGLSAVGSDSEYNLGLTGMHGRYASSKANSRADLILAVGVRFSDRATGNKTKYSQNARIIHIDIDPAEIGKNISAYLGLIGDIGETLKSLLEQTKPKRNPQWRREIAVMLEEERSFYPKDKLLHPKTVLETLQKYTDGSTSVATDVGQHQMWTAQYYRFQTPRSFLTSGGLGTMGFGMGAAIGGCVAKNKERTVLITGDGSFGMNLNELATAVSYELPLVILIMNNGVLGMVRQWQNLFYENRYSHTTLNRKTDFVRLAQAFGADAFRVSSPEELDAALERAFRIAGPVVIDCIIDKDEHVLPMIPPGGSIDDIIVK